MRRFRQVERIQDLPKINLNKAPFQELVRLSFIGPVIANRIIEYRKHCPFQHVDDLVVKLRLSQSLVDKLSDRLVV
jgi:competence protein ComEA